MVSPVSEPGLLNLVPLAFTLATSAFCAVIFRIVSRFIRSNRHNIPYPPGPPSPNFLLGHFGKTPKRKPYIDYQEMGKTYGDVIYLRSLRDHIVVINSAQAANDLLEKQARVSSDRPFGNATDKLAGWGTNIALRPYDETWRQSRRAFHQNFRSEAVVKYQPIQMEKMLKFLRALSSSPNPDQLWNDISTLSQGIMFSSIYGMNIASKKEALPQAARLAADQIDWNLLPGAVAIKSIPFIHLLPSLFPYCNFSRVQNKIRETIDQLRDGPFTAAMEAWKSSNHPSLVGELMSKNIANGGPAQEVDNIKDMGSSALIASADTTTSATASFFFAISLYPDVQTKAQEELDRVLGRGKIPQFSDRSSLPYIEAIYRELMRRHPTVPTGVPHRTTEDIIYRGYLIPKGAILNANIWAITHDPIRYPDPYKFIPERHLRPDGKFDNINSITAYGFGRRVCVGRYIADSTLWLTIACVLATMNISRENTGMEKCPEGMEIEEYFTDGGLYHLKNTVPGCKVQPRFSAKELEAAFEQI